MQMNCQEYTELESYCKSHRATFVLSDSIGPIAASVSTRRGVCNSGCDNCHKNQRLQLQNRAVSTRCSNQGCYVRRQSHKNGSENGGSSCPLEETFDVPRRVAKRPRCAANDTDRSRFWTHSVLSCY